MNRVFRPLLILILLSLLLACGSKRNPTGGALDTDKPAVLATLPAQFGQITDGRIEINFSKYLDKSSITQAVYIYPPVLDKKISVEKSSLRIRFNEKLQEDTNYYVTLSTRLKDIRGNALAQNQTLVFAHGKLSNLRIAGMVASENAADKNLPIQLTLLSADSLLVLNQTIQGSAYALEALNPAAYILRAYIDKNLNGRFDLIQEPAFELAANVRQATNIDISLAYADTTKPVIRSAVAKSRREIELTLSEIVESYGSVSIQHSSTQAELPILISSLDRDKLTLLTAAQDSAKYVVSLGNLKDFKGNRTTLAKIELQASNTDDTVAPAVTFSNPRNGTSVNNLRPVLELQFSEIIPLANLSASLTAADSKQKIALDVLQSDGKIYRFQPKEALQNYRSHILSISASDISGNKLKEEYKLQFLPLLRSE